MNFFALNRNHGKPRRAWFVSVLGCFLFSWFCLPPRLFAAEPAISFSHDIQPLVEQYCYKCHGAAKPKAGVNLEQFKDDTSVWRDPRLWETVVSQLRERAMPPDGKPQPSEAERERLTGWVAAKLDSLDRGDVPRDPGRVLIHRLSRFEYNNTVRDLFGVKSMPADKFPADGGGGAGFDNNASTLFIPPILMEKFLAAADEILAEASPEKIFIAKAGGLVSSRRAARKIADYFVLRIFRRPPERAETDRFLALYDAVIKRGAAHEDAVKQMLKAMLVSPHFLFRIEIDQDNPGPYRISDYELASRLSYFLWSSTPDDALFRLAEQKRLHEFAVLQEQVRRMMADPKARALAENFAGQWLRVKELKTSARPDPRRFPEFSNSLRDAMIEEPLAVFHSIVQKDRSLLELIDADYTYANEELAKSYGIAGVSGSEFRRVELADRRRGGVLGMGAVLTLTSYPLRTSPVLRGKWVLEEILGASTPPPPPMVKSLPQDDRPQKGLTFRQQLEVHRTNPECANCHKRMDPLGFGLENFDPIGRWRDEISEQPVDASGQMVTGEKFNGPTELKKILENRKEEFIRNLTGKMLSYALGRGLEYYDIPVVRLLAKAVLQNKCRSSTLIVEIVTSYPFQYRRNQPLTVAEK